MPANQPTSDLTTRDVLTQVDRRVSLMETDVRDLREHMDARFDETGRESNRRFGAIDTRLNALRAEVNQQFAALRAEGNARWRWTVGLILVSWVSLMGTNLIR